MKRSLILMMMAAVVMSAPAASALADEPSTSQPPKTHKQRMKECVDHEMSANSGTTHADARKTCQVKVKQEMDPTATNQAGAGAPDKP